MFFGHPRQLKHHCQGGRYGTATFGLPSPMPNGGEGALDGIGGAKMRPMLGRIIVGSKELLLILAQAFPGFGIFGSVKSAEISVHFEGF